MLAFGDANATWAPDALRKLVRNFADPDVAYVCGQVRFQRHDGTNKEGLYWRYEMWLRESESALGSITGGNGAIYAVRRSDYVEWPFGHDQGFPNLMVQKGRRAVYEPEALAFEKPSRHNEDEFRRKVRMLPWSWRYLFEAGPLRGVPPMYLFELLSHRVLRYASGFLHVGLLVTSIALVGEGWIYQAALAAQALWLLLAVAGKLEAARAGRRDRLVLPVDDRRHDGRARPLPAGRRAADVGEGRGHPLEPAHGNRSGLSSLGRVRLARPTVRARAARRRLFLGQAGGADDHACRSPRR